MKLTYNVEDKPKFGQLLVFALQQLLAIMAATITVPAVTGHGMSAAAALFGAGAGTIVYLLFTRSKSPVFLGSSFAFLGSLGAAFAGAATLGATEDLGYAGMIIGAVLAGLVYVVIALVIKCAGSNWVDKLMPARIVGPAVAIIGLSLATNAIHDLLGEAAEVYLAEGSFGQLMKYEIFDLSNVIRMVVGLITLTVTMVCSVYGKKKSMIKMIPFVIGIGAGYLAATIFTLIGGGIADETVKAAFTVIDFTKFKEMTWIPEFTFVRGFAGFKELFSRPDWGSYLAGIAVAYVPVGFVVFAEHLADHKNISSIIERDLLAKGNPGLDNTLLGDGVGSMVGAFFGGCPNTTYGESIGTVAISGNASIITIWAAAIMAIVISFIAPFSTFLATIPGCVMGGVCTALYGFIAVSGLKMIQKVDLEDNRNLFVVSVILIAGVGGFAINIGGKVTITTVACALILGILTNILLSGKKEKDAE